MRKGLVLFLLIHYSYFLSFAQEKSYYNYYRLAKTYYTHQKYMKAYEFSTLAYEFANSSIQKEAANGWRKKCSTKIEHLLDTALYLISEKKRKKEVKVTVGEKIKIGKYFRKKGDYENALHSFHEAYALDSNDVTVLNELRYLYFKFEDYESAYKKVKRLTVLDSLNSLHFYNLSHYALYNNQFKEAVEAGRKAKAMDSKRNWVISYIAIAYILMDEYEKAKEIYRLNKNKTIVGHLNKAGDGFFNDILELERAGIEHKDFEKAKDYVNPYRK